MSTPLVVFAVLALLLVGIGVGQADKIAGHPGYPKSWYAVCGVAAALFVALCSVLPPTL